MEAIDSFIMESFKNMQDDPKKGRYFHTLSETDNAPLVVHRKTNQFTYVIKGTGTGWFGGEKKRLQKGDKIFVKAGTAHKFKADGEGLTLFHIHIPDEGRENDREILQGDDYGRYV